MAIEEKLLTVPLKKSWIDRPKLKRHTAAANAIRAYFYRHMKAEDVKISSGINQFLHQSGSKWVPGKIQVKAIKDGPVVNVLLPDEKMKPKEVKKTLKEKLLGKKGEQAPLTSEEKKELEEFKKKKEDGSEASAKPTQEKKEEHKIQPKPEAKQAAKPKTEEKK